jgi:small subunit ribosomal protein S21
MRSVFREMRRRRFYEKPSDKLRERKEAIRRRHKRVRKQAIRDGLIAAPVRKHAGNGNSGIGSPGHIIRSRQG